MGGIKEWMKRICPRFTPSRIALTESARETVFLPRLDTLSIIFFCLMTLKSTMLKWDDNLRGIIKKSHQRLFFLSQLKKFGISKVGMFNFYRAVIESVLTFSLIVWFGSSTDQQRSQINNITRVALKIIGYDLPTIDEIYVSHLQKKGLKILKDPLHPARHLFTPLPSGRRLRAIKTKSTRFLNSTYCRIVHLQVMPVTALQRPSLRTLIKSRKKCSCFIYITFLIWYQPIYGLILKLSVSSLQRIPFGFMIHKAVKLSLEMYSSHTQIFTPND